MATMIDHDPKGQDQAIRRLVDILQASHQNTRDHTARQAIARALDAYKGTVAELVLRGSLDIEQGQELSDIVDRIYDEETR